MSLSHFGVLRMSKIFAAMVVLVVAGLAVAAELKSGPQAGDKVPGPFHVRCHTSRRPRPGEKNCLYLRERRSPRGDGLRPHAGLPADGQALKKLDEATKATLRPRWAASCVFLSDDDKWPTKLKAMTDKEKIKNLVVAVDNSERPGEVQRRQGRGPDDRALRRSHSEGELHLQEGQDHRRQHRHVIKDLSKILPEKK